MIFGIALVKDEADVIERTVRHMAGQVDGLLIADNGSTDGTREILGALAEDLPLLIVLDDPEVAHYQARKLTTLATQAGMHGADWVVPFDADELVSSIGPGIVADALRGAPRAWIFTTQLYEYRPSTHDDLAIADPYARIGWRRTALNPLLKIACRVHRGIRIHEGSHSVDYDGSYPRTVAGALITRHFPYRSPEQFVKKIRNGARGRNATDLPEDIGNHLRGYGRILDEHGPGALEREFDQFVVHPLDSDATLTYDPVPAP